MHAGELLSGYLDDELTSEDRRLVERHLDGCAECLTELEGVAEIRRRLRDLVPLEVPPGVYDFPATVVPMRNRVWSRAMAVAAAAVLVVGVGFGLATDEDVPLQLQQAVDQHVARASVDPGFNVVQVQAVIDR